MTTGVQALDVAPATTVPDLEAAGDDADIVDAPDWQRLPAATLRAWRVDNLVGLVVASGVLGVLAVVGRPQLVQPWLLPAAGLAVIAAVVEHLVLLPRQHRRYRYAVTDRAVVVENGALVRRQLVVPLRQVLYVETHQGPVLRAYGLTRTRLGTIADPRSVGPLTREAALVLRAAVERSASSATAERQP